MRKILSLFLNLLLSVSLASAGQIVIQWEPNTETNLAGYKVYYGSSPRSAFDPKICGLCGYLTSINVGNVTTFIVPNLADGQTYYLSLTAYNTLNKESLFSTEISGLASVDCPEGPYRLYLPGGGGGMIVLRPACATYALGQTVTFMAVAYSNSGKRFGSWSGDFMGLDNPLSYVFSGSKTTLTLIANFVPIVTDEPPGVPTNLRVIVE